MFRSPWELEAQVRYQTARLADERRADSIVNGPAREPAESIARLRRSLGLGLIAVGERLVGRGANDALSPAPRPSTAARGG